MLRVSLYMESLVLRTRRLLDACTVCALYKLHFHWCIHGNAKTDGSKDRSPRHRMKTRDCFRHLYHRLYLKPMLS